MSTNNQAKTSVRVSNNSYKPNHHDKANYNDYYVNINNIFRDRQLKKLIKGQIVYDEMLILIENKNKEIEELKRKLELKE